MTALYFGFAAVYLVAAVAMGATPDADAFGIVLGIAFAITAGLLIVAGNAR